MPVEMFRVVFAIGRTSGRTSRWLQMIDDQEPKIARPRQIEPGRHRLYCMSIAQRSWLSRLASSPTRAGRLDGRHQQPMARRG